tara:strand:+ start:2455 stop:3597 length:1143 start_codon:yes stop_codon:yes gene_type:complete
MGGGSSGGKSNDKETAQAQERIAANQLQFDRERAAEQAARQANIDAYQKTVDDRRFALDLRGEERADRALAFQNTLAQQQADYQKQRDEKLFGLQQQQFELTQQDLKFYQDKSTREEERILAKDKAAEEKEAARLALGAEGYDAYKEGLEQQLRSGLINAAAAQEYLQDYASTYQIAGKQRQDSLGFGDIYGKEVLQPRYEQGVGTAYEEVLGRAPTEEEYAKAMAKFNVAEGFTSASSLKEDLYKTTEYKDKFDKSYLESYYDTVFGKEIKDEEGYKTGDRTFKFDKSLLPTYKGDLAERTGVELPNFADEFTGKPFELEAQLDNIKESRQFLYNAGLTNLQGEIDQQTQKIKNEGMKEIQKIAAQGDIYKSVIGSFSF